MNDQLEIRTTRDYINWQLDQPLNATTIKNQLEVQVVNRQGQVIDAEVLVMTKAVNVNQVGTYTATLVAEDDQGNVGRKQIEVNVVELRSRQQATNPQTAVNSQPAKKRHKWIVIGIIIVLLICCIFAIRSCQNRQTQEVNNATQSSQISNNSSSIAENSSSIESLKGDNAKLAQQVAALRGAVKQYKEDHDQQALQSSLNNIEQQNNQIQSSLSQTNQGKLNQVTQAAQNIAQNPDNADSEIQNLKENGFGQLWDNITSQVQTWLNQHTSNN